jgi:fermentation-respiration switch protein FrsA (DUF1100 family)
MSDQLTQAEKFAREAARLNPPAPGRGWKYYVKRAAIYLVAGYLLLCGAFFFLQNRIVYRPAVSAELGVTQSGFGVTQARDIETQTPDGVTLSGWHLAVNSKTYKKLSGASLVVLYFGGNEGNRSVHDQKFFQFVSMGVDVVCFDYRGFGDSEGKPSEDGLARDARAAWDYCIGQGAAPKAIVLYGEALGGAVAVRLASELSAEGNPPAGVVLESTFTKFAEMEGRAYPFLPVSLLLTQRFRAIDQMPKVQSALLMLHGARDTLVPISLGKELFAAAPARSTGEPGIEKKFIELPNCDHDSVGIDDAMQYDTALVEFFKTLCPSLAGHPRRPMMKQRPVPKDPKARKKTPKEKPQLLQPPEAMSP